MSLKVTESYKHPIARSQIECNFEPTTIILSDRELNSRLLYVAYTAKKIVEIIFRYLHSFLGDRPDYFRVLCNTHLKLKCNVTKENL